MPKVYRDENGHFTSKDNDGGVCHHEGGSSREELNKKYFSEDGSLKEGLTYSQYYDELGGKTQETSTTRKDKYGNELVSDKAFNVGLEAAKKYIEESGGWTELRKSNMGLTYLQDVISDAINGANLNPDYNLTYQDFDEIIGAATGEVVDTEKEEGGAFKGLTGKKYNGYVPKPIESENLIVLIMMML